MVLCLLIATIFFIASICVVASALALILFMLGVCIFAISFFIVDSSLIFAFIFLAYAGFVIIMSLFTNDRKTSFKKHLLIISVPCLYLAYRIYSLSCSSDFFFSNSFGNSSLFNYSELLGLVSMLLLCGIFCVCISLKPKHDIKKPPEDD